MHKTYTTTVADVMPTTIERSEEACVFAAAVLALVLQKRQRKILSADLSVAHCTFVRIAKNSHKMRTIFNSCFRTDKYFFHIFSILFVIF